MRMLTTTEERIVARAREFDPAALVAALGALGYCDRDIVWKSRLGWSRGHTLVHAVEIERLPRRRAIVTLNLGLLGSETPLPSYMLKLIEQSNDRLLPFFEYFDHVLLRRRVRALWPERDPEIGSDWSSTCRNTSRLVRMASPAMAHWLFRRVYPELEVSVRRAPVVRTIPTSQVVLGRAAIGDGSALGGVTQVLGGGVAATLLANEPLASGGRPWQEEAARRLRELLLPALVESDISLTAMLIIRDRPSFLRIAPESSLGLQPLQSGSNATKVLLYDGLVRPGSGAASLLGQPLPASPVPVPVPSPALVAAASAPARGHLPEAPSPEAESHREAQAEAYFARIR